MPLLWTFALRTRLIRKSMCETLRGANATGRVLSFTLKQAFAKYILRRVGHTWLFIMFWLSFSHILCLKFVPKLDHCTTYIKTNNECFLIRAMEQIFLSGERQKVPFNFTSVSEIFHLSPHENTIALINIHYLYTCHQWGVNFRIHQPYVILTLGLTQRVWIQGCVPKVWFW